MNDRSSNRANHVGIKQIGRLVAGEARRMLADEAFEADPELVAAGWIRRFMSDARRIGEAADLYRDFGFEVLEVPVELDEVSDECSDCQLLMHLQFKMIYTRRRNREIK